MKRTILAAVALSAAMSALAAVNDGTIDIQNKISGSLDAKVTDTVTMQGVKGPDFVMGLNWGTSEGSLQPAYNFATGQLIAIPFLTTTTFAGYINPSPVTFTITGMPSATTVFVQLTAWDITKGADYTTSMNALGKVGLSNIISVKSGGPDPDPANPPSTSPKLKGLTPFTVQAVPEPSILGLGLIGAAALMLRRRR